MAVPPTLQYYSCCIGLHWHFGIFCVSMLILGFFSCFYDECLGDVDLDCTKSKNQFWWNAHFYDINSSNSWKLVSFHLLASSSISSGIKVFIVVVFQFFSACLLLVYGETTDFCKMILDPATLLKLQIVSRSFLVEFLESLKYIMTPCAVVIILPLCFLFVAHLSPFLAYALDRASKFALKRIKDHRQPCLITDFNGLLPCFHHLGCCWL